MQGNSRLGAGLGVYSRVPGISSRRAATALLLFLLLVCSLETAYAATHLVTGGDNVGTRAFFSPDLTIAMGDSVQWTRDPTVGFEEHSTTSGSCSTPIGVIPPNCTPGPTGPGGLSWGGTLGGPGGFFFLVISPTLSDPITFHFAGDYPYFCQVHPDIMRGIIRVSKANTNVSVSRTAGPSSSTFGQSVTFTVTVNSLAPGPSIPIVKEPTGNVTLRSNGSPIATLSVSRVNDSQSTVAFVTTALPVGTGQLITAVYNGDANFSVGTSGSVSQTVTQATPTVTLTNPTNPSNLGQLVTFTARVSGPATAPAAPAGNVTFRNGVTVLGTGALSSAGQPAGQAVATFTKSDLLAGTHDIRADYPGNTNYTLLNNTTLSPGQQVVNKGNPTVSVSSTAPAGAFVNQTITFTAALSGPVATPTGTVTFLDNGTPIPGNATLASGVATKNVNTLTGGSHTITASYGGDTNFNTNSGSLNTNPQLIRDFAVSATPNPLSGTSGQTRTFNVTLTSLGSYGPRDVNISCAAGGTSPPGSCLPLTNPVNVPSGGTANFSVNVSSGMAADTTFNFNIVGQDTASPFGPGAAALQRQQAATYNVVSSEVDMRVSQLLRNTGPDPVQLGETVQLNITLLNASGGGCGLPPCTGHAVIGQVNFSAPVSGIVASASNGVLCTQGTPPISCDFGTVNDGQSRTITVAFPAPFVRQLTATASVNSGDSELTPMNNSLPEVINIRFRPWLRVPLKLP